MARAPGAGDGVAVTVTLRAVSPTDEGWLDGWLPAVAASVGYEADVGAGAKRSIIEREGAPVGVLIHREHTPRRDAAIIELIGTPHEHARRGAGMEAAAALEDQLRARGTRTIYAPAPEIHGIAMYFWIRLGYRPLLRGEWPCKREGVAWLMRRLEP